MTNYLKTETITDLDSLTGGYNRDAVVNSLSGLESENFNTGSSDADKINPKIWDEELQAFQESELSFVARFREYTTLLGTAGSSHVVNLDETPDAAELLVEGDPTPVSELFFDDVEFTPDEYGKAYQVSRKELRRTFVDVMPNIVQKIAYSLVLNQEQVAIEKAIDDAAHEVFPDGVSDETELSDEPLTPELIARARRLLRESKFSAEAVDVTPKQFEDLILSDNLVNVNMAGSDDALRNYATGRLFAMEIAENDELPQEYNGTEGVQVAICSGSTKPGGDYAMGISWKLQPEVRMAEYVRDRFAEVAGEEEWDIQTMHPGGLAVIVTA